MKQKHPKKTQPDGTVEYLQSGDWKSCYQNAEHFYAQGVYQEAFSWYKKASLLPDCNPIVFFELGYLFQHGEGVDSDNIEALKWYEKAASLGVPQAMYNLAYFYQNGLIVDQDIQRAAQLLRDATSLMDRLQLERGSYDVWKAEHDTRLAAIQRDAEKERAHSEHLESRNRELDIDLSASKQECQRLEQEVAQHKRALQESKKQCVILAKQHNEIFERVQSSYTAQIDRLQRAYETDFTELQKEKERLAGQNADLSRMFDRKMLELNTLQKTSQKLQMQFDREQKKKRLALIFAGIFGVLTLILLI